MAQTSGVSNLKAYLDFISTNQQFSYIQVINMFRNLQTPFNTASNKTKQSKQNKTQYFGINLRKQESKTKHWREKSKDTLEDERPPT